MATKKRTKAKTTPTKTARPKRASSSAKKKASPKKRTVAQRATQKSATKKRTTPKKPSKKSSTPQSTKTRTSTQKRGVRKESSKRGTAAQTKEKSRGDEIVTIDRRHASGQQDPRLSEEPGHSEGFKLELRKKVQRRRQIDPTTCERDYSFEEVEFMSAMDEYKRKSGRSFPTCSEVLEVVRSLGYAKQSPQDVATVSNDRPFVDAPSEPQEDRELVAAGCGHVAGEAEGWEI